jgi:catechol 2,3-dioxygenase-like lactoylglutathione lyase family enzyme
MTSQLHAICFLANEPRRLARFWSEFLGRELVDDARDGVALLPGADNAYRLRFIAHDEPKLGQNRAHFDLTSAAEQDQQQTVARALELGARHTDVGQLPEEGHVVLADPEGNEFCVIEAGNNFLAGCGFVGALAGDGTQAVGYFWSAALDWPLVWDQDEETAIQSPGGGTKITWGGPPLMPRTGKDRVRLDLAVPVHSDIPAEIDRLISLGAKRIETGPGDDGRVLMTDPDGNEFTVRG